MVTNRSQFINKTISSSTDILVVGSVNIDRTCFVERFPTPGETYTAKESQISLGGKGLNQALAAAMTGAKVVFVGSAAPAEIAALKTATQPIGSLVLEIEPSNEATGSAWICVATSGENFVIVNPGANHFLSDAYIEHKIRLHKPRIVMVQGEISASANNKVGDVCRELNIPIALNPSPMRPEDSLLVEDCRFLILNKLEASEIVGREIDTLEAAAEAARALAITDKTVVITLGVGGSVFSGPLASGSIPSWQTNRIVDTTGAGDRFAGTLCGWLSQDKELVSALTLASEEAGKICELPNANELLLN